ncbi:ATP-binding protein [Pseudohalocynthiibacter aestuariivivens]|jgi:serine/threonine-protein kinase RsbW|uniref:ATP-binding protein n=1 Tax=Pseudohalocynthiibacter aestuariivivens TaxID=1591409 RepID=A0ABV5JDP6_9RHOB|nr:MULTISPECIES: ATP-binding protein [Pseudohalocynthiibacter]MBS9717990.1 ATP-binding protein [Pseudohalocynthiibacter aestuariivivens]MCK0103162.1 ATP-binding protein [Pseudohalocynthiibacter sp. F2068]
MKNGETLPPEMQKNELRITFLSDPLSVRRALEKVLRKLGGLGTTPEARRKVELALAEVLNNIVEHAYPITHEGKIDLRITLENQQVKCVVSDDGLPLPNSTLPVGHLQVLSNDICELPEGGFGWFLIGELSDNLQYNRAGGKNILSFHIGLEKT